MPRIVALVDDQAIAVCAVVLRSDLRNFCEHVRERLRADFVHLGEQFEVILGHSQKVHFSLGLDILENEHFFVFVNFGRGDLPLYYFAEYAIVA